ncbi:MAG: phosphoribosylglycinamide formyltransferase [Clostridia bacterium]|nr:phosphoribosylglycinamide formyltransferase [Clostridia bacterium]
MLKANIAVLVSGGGTNLQALIDAEKSGIIQSGSIKLVVANNSKAYALERAKNAGIDTAVVLKSQLGSQEAFEKELIRVLEDANTDLIVLAGFMSILSADFTNHFKDKIINVHPSLIPSFCGKGFYGLKVHEAALEYGVKVSGATVHFVNEIPDGGKIIMQKAVEVMEGDTPEVLQKRIMEEAEWKILPLSCEKICSFIIKEKN